MAACGCACFFSVLVLLVFAGASRVYWILFRKKGTPSKRTTPVKVMIVAGSGGHTSEILRLVCPLSAEYRPRVYVVADTDKMSEEKINALEQERSSKQGSDVLTNGPGTCVPICLAAFAMKVIGYHDATIIYVESICRVNTLSLSGKILYRIVDRFLVQWKQLTQKYPQAIYLGRLV